MSGTGRALAILSGFAGTLSLAHLGLRGPAPVDRDAPAEMFSAGRAFDHVLAIARNHRPSATAGIERARSELVARIQAAGLSPEEDRWTSEGIVWNERRPRERPLVNLLARVAPAELPPAASILFVAHYDSVAGCPGASDDAAGVAALLEAIRVLHQRPPRRTQIFFLFTDGEELGRIGAKRFVAERLPRERVDAVFNLDSLGNRAPLQIFEIGPDSSGIVRAYARHARHPVGSSFAGEVHRVRPNRTDLAEFIRAGVPGLNFACLNGAVVYHRSVDTPDRLDLRALQHQGEAILALARALDEGGIERDNTRLTFFTLPGPWMARYPAWIDLALAVAAGLGIALAVSVTRTSVPGLVRGASRAAVIWLVVAAAAWLAWRTAAWVYPDPQGTAPDDISLAGILLCALGSAAWVARLRLLPGDPGTSLAACATWLACGFAAWVWAPGAMFVFVLPSLLVALGWLARTERTRRLALTAAGFAVLMVLLPILSPVHSLGRLEPPLGAGITSVATAALAPLFWPLVSEEDGRTLVALGAAATALGFGGLLFR